MKELNSQKTTSARNSFMVYINGGSKVSLQYTVVVLKIFEEVVKEKPNRSRSLSVSFQKNL